MTVSNWSATLRRGAFAGLALLLAAPCSAEEALRDRIRTQMGDTSYVLVEDEQGARLFVFSSDGNAEGSISFPQVHRPFSDALKRTRSSDARSRVRGLTLLSGVPGDEALNAALVLLSDPHPAVREEAVHLISDHPRADVESMLALARNDPSPRVREAVEDLLGEDLIDEDEDD